MLNKFILQFSDELCNLFFISFKKTLPTFFQHIRCDTQQIFIHDLNMDKQDKRGGP